MSVEQIRAARSAFFELGFQTLKAALPGDLLSALRTSVTLRYGGLSEEELSQEGAKVGHERYMLPVELCPPFDDPALFASPPVLELLEQLLGPGFVLSSFSLVIAFPGATDQHVHMDHSHLFPGARDEPLCLGLPPYAITVVIPLLDLTRQTGGTRVWAGSHRQRLSLWGKLTRARLPLLPLGDVLLMDYRLIHGGTQNRSQLPRPVLYLVYNKPWFQDAENFQERRPLRLPSPLTPALKAHQALLYPALYPAVRRSEAADRGPSPPPGCP